MKGPKFKKIMLIFLAVVILAVIFLEILSRIPCANISIHYQEGPCLNLIFKYRQKGSDLFYPNRKTLNFKDINNKEFLEKVPNRTFYAPVNEVQANGIACMNFAFVSEELPTRAKWYVTLHENIHLEGERNEARTNLLAARLEPIGFIQTVFYSLWLSIKSIDTENFPCRFGMLWNVFKLYFVNF